ncbi:MAG: sn-glycerol-3-phosphate ABC transporter ATP-binding protein UgpC [Rhizobium sp.]
MASVTIKNTQKSYGAAKVLHGVDIDIQDGEFVVLVGPSGCGKSTLLRMLAGLESISGGTISIGDKVVNDVPPKQRDIAMVFQNYALYPHMTVEDNMSFSLKLKGVPAEEKKRKVGQAAAILGLEKLLGRFPKELSGGQRQRVAMGRAIVRDPQVFLFDEPLSNLDAKLRVQMRAEIKQLHQRLRTTTVYVTHDQIEAMTMADKIVVMRDGRVEQIGTPLDLYDHPANLFVASFLGSPGMNFVTGKISAVDTSVFETDGGSKIDLEQSLPALSGKAATLGVRPENWSLVSSDERSLQATISVIEPTGAETMLLLKHGDEQLMVSIKHRPTLAVGEHLYLTPQAGAIHLFDPATGLRLN